MTQTQNTPPRPLPAPEDALAYFVAPFQRNRPAPLPAEPLDQMFGYYDAA